MSEIRDSSPTLSGENSRELPGLSSGPRSRYPQLVLGILVIVPLLAAITVYGLFKGFPDVCLGWDKAILEIYTRHASQGTLLLGPYSRFGWHHPGPSYFYLLAPFYVFSGGASSTLFFGALSINTIAIVSILVVCAWCVGDEETVFFSWVLLMTALLIQLIGIKTLCNPWNPYVTRLAFALLIFLCATLCLGRCQALPAIGAVASFVIQTHLGSAACAIAIVASSLSLYALPSLRRAMGLPSTSKGNAKRSAILTGMVLMVMWFLPLIEQVTANPGNLSGIYAFFKAGALRQDAYEVLVAVSRTIAFIPVTIVRAAIAPISGVLIDEEEVILAAVQVALLPLAYWMAIRKRLYLGAALCVLVFIALPVAFWSAMHIRDPHIWGYLTLWITSIGFVNVVAVGGVILQSVAADFRSVATRASTVAAPVGMAVVLLIMGAITCKPLLKPRDLPPRPNAQLARLSGDLLVYLKEHRIERPLIQFPYPRTWLTQAALIGQLYKADIAFAMKPHRWPLMFDDSYAPTGEETKTIVVGGPSLANRPGYDLVTRQGNIALYVKDLED